MYLCDVSVFLVEVGDLSVLLVVGSDPVVVLVYVEVLLSVVVVLM